LRSFYKDYGGQIGLAYMTKTTSPYNIKFDYLGILPTSIGAEEIVPITPLWANQFQQYNTVKFQGSNILSAQLYDELGLSSAWLSTNETGVWENKTLINLGSISKTWVQVNFTWKNDSVAGPVVAWRIYFNNIYGKQNSTDILTFKTTSLGEVLDEIENKIKDIPKNTWEVFLIYGTPPLMPSTSYYCLDNQTLIKKIPRTVCFDNKCENITIEEEIKCQYGCNMEINECNPPTWQPFLYIMGGLIVLMFLVVIIYKLVGR
jgi:hypothetical protein